MDELKLQNLFDDCLEEIDCIIAEQDVDIFNIRNISLLCNKSDTEDDFLILLKTKMEQELELPVSLVDYETVDSDLFIEPGCIIPTLGVEE